MRSLTLLLLLPIFVFAQQEQCKLTKTSSYVGETLQFEFTYTYNSQGKILTEKEFRTEGPGSFTLGKTYTYNEKGFVSKITSTQNGDFRSNTFREYDKLGNMISEVESTTEVSEPLNRVAILGNSREKLFYEKNGTVGAREVEVKDVDGNVILKEIRGPQGELYSAVSTKYNSKKEVTYSKSNDVVGNLIEEKYYQFDAGQKLVKDSTAINGVINERTLYQYDNKGFLIKKSLLGANSAVEYVIDYKVDSEGNTIEESFIYKGELLNRKVYTYLGKQVSKEEQYNNKGDLVRTRTWEYNCN
ncbi:hypothetical protein SAMN06298216_2373 [Spirosomataceae bacterium TFI 002]|nr:hypothetical protein SAMN06298216_2373 [Spirosomataceae bacterium TFI 002]